jgi:UDP-N-acetylmuramate dehydrogenase
MMEAHDHDHGDAAALAAVLDRLGPVVRRNVSLASMCTYKVGGPAAGYIDVDDVGTLETVRAALDGVERSSVPILLVGRGSNLLVSDAGFAGIVLRLGSAFDEVTIDAPHQRVIAGGAALLPVVARKTAAAGLTGFEWAVGVPGSIGGAVRMNAGGHGADMAETLVRISSFDLFEGGPTERTADDLDLAYRTSSVRPSEVVLSAEMQLRKGDRLVSEAAISEIVRWRRGHQPGGQNAGSVFTNPTGDSAGRLIDAAGLKGMRIGTAEVSTKHANFIQADPDGRADDVVAVIREVQRRVRETFGIELHPENVLVGFAADQSAAAHRNDSEGEGSGT